MTDIHEAHRTLKSASIGYSTSENRIGFLRGVCFKNSNKHWSWQPMKKRKLVCKDIQGRFIKIENL